MAKHFNTITESNKLSLNKAADTDVVYYSELNEWFTSNAFRSFSLKYVVDECIHYKVDNREYSVTAGRFLMACKQPFVKAYFATKKIVKSICIDICPATLAQAFTVMTSRQSADFDNYSASYFTYPEFFESICPVAASPFTHKLQQLVTAINTSEAEALIDKEWFLDLVEKIVCHEYGNYLALNGLQSLKSATRKELLTRLFKGRQFIDQNCLSIDNVAQIALASNMSEFHFFRSFRQAYGVTPYQYLLNKRLGIAYQLVCNTDLSLTAIAHQCNFPDLFTFSKAFKRQHHCAPSEMRTSYRYS